jgi:putative membrane protein
VSFPPTAAALSIASLYALYLTPMYRTALEHPLLHEALHLHFFLSGCLLMSALVARDPSPWSSNVRLRGATLVAAWAAHAALAKLLYANASTLSGGGPASVATWRLGAEIMWYGGDVIELAVLAAFFVRWYRLEARRLGRQGFAAPEDTEPSAAANRP